MGVVKSIIHLGGGQGFSVPASRSIVYRDLFDEFITAIGRDLTPARAMTYVPFYAGVKLISESVGRMPLILYRKTGDNARERAEDKVLYRLLHDEPNPEMSAQAWKTTSVGHLVTRGNCYSEQVRDDLGRVAQLWPMRPDRVAVLRDTDTGEKFYRVRIESLGDTVDLRKDQVFHVPGFGYDGMVGYSIVTLFRQSLALGLAAEEFGARFFKSGAQPAAVVHHPADWDDDRIRKFGAKLRANHAGLSNAQRIALLEEGVTWEQTGMNLDDAQFIETRRMSKADTATMLNLPPHMIGDVERSTSWGTGIEEQTLGFVTFNLGGWTDLFSSEANRQLVRPAYPEGYYSEFLLEALLKGRSEDRAKFYRALWEMGVINADGIADKENLPRPENNSGQVYYRPLSFGQSIVPSAESDVSGPTLIDVINAVSALAKIGFDPARALEVLGGPAIPHTGLEPVTVSEQGDYASGGNGSAGPPVALPSGNTNGTARP